MLVTFTTDAYADITMFRDIALKMLKMMRHSATIPSAILAEDMPAAIDRLAAAINAGEFVQRGQHNVEDERVISMAHTEVFL